jgi:hypothetical protein
MSIHLSIYVICLQPFYGKGSHHLLWAGLEAVGEKMTISGIRNCLNYCEVFIMYTRITNVALDYIMQPGGLHVACGLQVRDP